MNTFFHRVAPAVALCLVPLSRVLAAGADPAQPSPGPTPTYHSAFSGYKPWRDIAPGDWRALNGAASAAMGAMGAMGNDGMAPMSHGQGGMAMPGMPMPMPVPGMPMPASARPAASAPHSGHDHGHGGQP